MASANGLRCLARPTIPVAVRLQPIVLSTAHFSTSHALAATGPPVRSGKTVPQKKSFKKKGAAIVPAKKAAAGERKAFRKRIQLSNNSALAVPGLTDIAAGTMALEENAGKMFGIPDAVVDQLRSLEAFKTTQTWSLFRRPHFLVRKETIELIKKLEESVAKKEAFKGVLTGTKLSGKSMAMLQAMSYALLNNWAVIHIPEGRSSACRHLAMPLLTP